jgi:hypothetical protein
MCHVISEEEEASFSRTLSKGIELQEAGSSSAGAAFLLCQDMFCSLLGRLLLWLCSFAVPCFD